MKAYKYIIATAGLLLSFSCSEFLEYRDKDKVIPENLDQYSELVYGEIIYKDMGDMLFHLEFMTDDMTSLVVPSSSSWKKDDRLDHYNYFTWAKEPQVTFQGDERINPIWEKMYQKILMCNIVEYEVGRLKIKDEQEEATQKRLIAEVQCMRAICYYYLINTYGDVYKDASQAATALGVPINNEHGISSSTYSRSSLAAVCAKMEEDLNLSEANFKEAEDRNTIFRPNMNIVLLMKSRLYLMMHRYDDVITICNQLLASTNKRIAPAEYVEKSNYGSRPFISKENPGILFSWWRQGGFYTNGYDVGRYVTDPNLLASYTNDLRLKAFFGEKPSSERYKFNSTYAGTLHVNYRIEEAYFNKAEAMLKKNPANYSDALSVVNEVRQQRINKNGTLLSATSTDDAWAKFKIEKRREFCFERMRWFDVRRWNERITHIYHDFSNDTNYVTYVLEAGSPNYVMSLPQDITRINKLIELPKRIDSKMIPNE